MNGLSQAFEAVAEIFTRDWDHGCETNIECQES